MGLHFIPIQEHNINLSQNITTCVRFNYHHLGHLVDKKRDIIGIILDIGNLETPESQRFLLINAKSPHNWLPFRNDIEKTGSSWILKNEFGRYDNVFMPHRWHHICFAFSKSLGKVIFAKVHYLSKKGIQFTP